MCAFICVRHRPVNRNSASRGDSHRTRYIEITTESRITRSYLPKRDSLFRIRSAVFHRIFGAAAAPRRLTFTSLRTFAFAAFLFSIRPDDQRSRNRRTAFPSRVRREAETSGRKEGDGRERKREKDEIDKEEERDGSCRDCAAAPRSAKGRESSSLFPLMFGIGIQRSVNLMFPSPPPPRNSHSHRLDSRKL